MNWQATWKRPSLRWLFLGCLTATAFVACLLEYSIRTARLPPELEQPPAGTPVVTDLRGATIAVLAAPFIRESYPIKLREMGVWLPLATVGIEDSRFWKHPGIDMRAVAGAALQILRNRRVMSGASTITQQLVKISSQRNRRTLAEKFHEAVASLKLERDWDKKKILETYLNRLDYGNCRIGPEAAAQAYYGKSARELSLPEAIFLAGLPQSPTRLNPFKNTDAALGQYRRNVKRLAKAGMLPADANVDWLLKNPPSAGKHLPPNEGPQFVQMARHRLAEANRAISNGRLRTSMDLDIQRLATRILREHLSATATLGVGDVAVVVIENSSGFVRALTCAGDPKRQFLNSAIEPRSCGSTLKPFLYLAAIDQRKLTAASLLPDTPEAIAEEYGDYDPQNYSNRYRGLVRLREALGSSLNVPAVVALSRLRARETFEYLRTWGLNFPHSFDAYGAGFILGNAPVRLLELAGAYAALARGGEFWPPKFTGNDVVASRRLASVEACAIIADILCDNRARQASFGTSSALNLPQRTAVKTGTSSGFRDGWCVGFSQDHTVAVWAGNLDGRPMHELLAVRSAAPLWAAIMKALYAAGDSPWPHLEESASLHAVEIATETGLLPRPHEPTLREWFLPGTEPTNQASTLYVDGILRLPPEYLAWCAGSQNRLSGTSQSEELKILFPKNGATFSYNPTLPKSQQMLPLQSSSSDCKWFLNGKQVNRPLIPLERGTWELTAQKAAQTAVANFVVE